MKNIFFIVKNLNCGSSQMRAWQIKKELKNKIENKIQIIDLKHIEQLFEKKNSILIWIGPHLHRYNLKIHNTNINILDIVDKYIREKKRIFYNLTNNLYDGLIVNSKFMKDEITKITKFKGKIFIIYHQWDPRYKFTKTNNNELIFGYIGSVLAIRYNFLHFNKLKDIYDIVFFDTEIGKNVTRNVKNNLRLNRTKQYEINNIPKTLPFNCHISIREYDTDVSKYKTTAKIATASALDTNIITTLDEAVKDVLPIDYPFILKKTDLNSVKEMMELVINDYNTNKFLWNKGISIMKNVKKILDIKNIIKKYKKLFYNYN